MAKPNTERVRRGDYDHVRQIVLDDYRRNHRTEGAAERALRNFVQETVIRRAARGGRTAALSMTKAERVARARKGGLARQAKRGGAR